MQLEHLALTGWRNLAPLEIAFDPRVNLFIGENAQGKTNLLEAIDYLATLRSFRSRRTDELLAFDAPGASLRARLQRRGLEIDIAIDLLPRSRRVLLCGKPIRTLSSYAGAIGATLFVPDDLSLPRGAPAARRRFLDRAIFAVLPAYLSEVRDFERLLKQRNAALRDGRGALLEAFDEPLGRTAARLVTRRRAQVERLNARLGANYTRLSGGPLSAKMTYTTVDWEAAGDEDAIAHAYSELLARRRPVDLARGHTTVGPHADDVAMLLDGRLVRSHASQGQTRAYVLALKLAEIDDFHEAWGDYPLLLLDDVTSELDDARVEYLLDLLSRFDAQAFLTTTDPALLSGRFGGSRWQVRQGCYHPSK